MDMSKSYCFSV